GKIPGQVDVAGGVQRDAAPYVRAGRATERPGPDEIAAGVELQGEDVSEAGGGQVGGAAAGIEIDGVGEAAGQMDVAAAVDRDVETLVGGGPAEAPGPDQAAVVIQLQRERVGDAGTDEVHG